MVILLYGLVPFGHHAVTDLTLSFEILVRIVNVSLADASLELNKLLSCAIHVLPLFRVWGFFLYILSFSWISSSLPFC